MLIRLAGVSYGRYMAMRYNINLSTCVQELLVTARRGCMGRDLNEER